ncbi:MAG: PTS IIA-like nitrogen regulatory protein PtsN [Oceanicoccus sp.]|uniref:PTS IIA-like nitrogen regulatory protein PtsN n=1 Tax=Oceanicoccus sp. TaxID=2691044 RepID=UPI0026126991|nr:PTS IIA-like nitrogen regulatory protein PtsN [Oceanicoccus sp.]MCP3906912.1 PTS IIA-like nitrogen regulatory protein PtsN [Oceanicoccus sp.]MDG1773847.1 PTS IIA-like nitrogen regulatory protein PtsN [Oceanicoccus sp.]
MKLDSILSPDRTLCGAPGSSKKRVLDTISQFICQDLSEFNPNQLFDNLLAREKLGSTGLGNGIAIPHCRITQCQSVIGTLIKLDEAVDFDAIDGKPVDLIFVLLVPEQAHDEHLNVLATLAERFSDQGFCQRLRSATDNESLYRLATAN